MKNNDIKRVFFCISVVSQIKSILSEIKFTLHYKSSVIKWIPVENIHLTLSFLGDISNNNISDLIKLVENNIFISKFQIRISKTGVFPSVKSPKVLWLGLDRGIDQIKILQNQIEELVRKFNKNYEKKLFIPHITIAKIKKGSPKVDVLPLLNSVYSPIEVEVNSISMYQSQLFRDGAQYTLMNTFPLTD